MKKKKKKGDLAQPAQSSFQRHIYYYIFLTGSLHVFLNLFFFFFTRKTKLENFITDKILGF